MSFQLMALIVVGILSGCFFLAFLFDRLISVWKNKRIRNFPICVRESAASGLLSLMLAVTPISMVFWLKDDGNSRFGFALGSIGVVFVLFFSPLVIVFLTKTIRDLIDLLIQSKYPKLFIQERENDSLFQWIKPARRFFNKKAVVSASLILVLAGVSLYRSCVQLPILYREALEVAGRAALSSGVDVSKSVIKTKAFDRGKYIRVIYERANDPSFRDLEYWILVDSGDILFQRKNVKVVKRDRM